MFDIILNKQITGETEDYMRRQLKSAGGEPVLLLINSGGGAVFAGMSVISMIREYAGYVTAEITGLAASMSSAIAVCADKLIVSDISTIMIHRASTFAGGNSEDLEKTISLLQGIDQQLAELYAAKSGMSTFKILELMSNETWAHGSAILNDYGLADEFKQTGTKSDSTAAITEAKERFAACYKPVSSEDVAAYSGTIAGNNDEASKLRAWIINNPGNEEVKSVVNQAISEGKSEERVMVKLIKASMGACSGLTADDIAAAKLVNLSLTEYRKYMPKN